MTVARDILDFLADPSSVAQQEVPRSELHEEALERIGRECLPRAGDKPFRQAQLEAWRGLSKVRAGLVLGPPGTGKTHLLSWLVLGHVSATLAHRPHSRAFLTAMTRSAIETLLIAIAKRAAALDEPVEIIYLAKETHEAQLPGNIRVLDIRDGGDRKQFRQLVGRPGIIIGGTVWQLTSAIEEKLFPGIADKTGPFFDLVAIDEASQLVVAHGLLALSALAPGGRIIVSGDDKQLPPVRETASVGTGNKPLGGSLYGFLKSNGVPEFPLVETFRLNGPLTRFPKEQIYGKNYESAPEIHDRQLALKTDWASGLSAWERIVLDPANPVVIVLHDGPRSSTDNAFEADVIADLSVRFRDRLCDRDGKLYPEQEFWAEGLGVVAPHRAQVRTLTERLRKKSRDPFVETVDRIQGKERDAIIVSYTVSDPEFALAEAEFLFSRERLNVATTRPRSKLVVFVSRRLLSIVPSEQENLDKAEFFRAFVFQGQKIWSGRISGGQTTEINAEILVCGFGNEVRQEVIEVQSPSSPQHGPLGDELTPELQDILDVVVSLGRKDKHGNGNAYLNQIARQVHRPETDVLPFLVALHWRGFVRLRVNKEGTWYAKRLDGRPRIYAVDDPALIEFLKGELTRPKHYPSARDSIAWMNDQGNDILRPVIERHSDILSIKQDSDGVEWLSLIESDQETSFELPALAPLSDDDFSVLNTLEDLEKARIDAGLFEVWSTQGELAQATGRDLDQIEKTIHLLARHGYVWLTEDDRVRSRMAEIARVVRHVKQRFNEKDARRRPYLVRSVKLEIRDRKKPERDVPLEKTIADFIQKPGSEQALKPIQELSSLLESLWGKDVKTAGFQARALQGVVSAWCNPYQRSAFVISADTGSGKTEAGLFPLLVGAALDAQRGIRGTRAILAYPRIRLASNQAQRIVKYLAAAPQGSGIAELSVGMQFREVPNDFRYLDLDIKNGKMKSWHREGSAWRFPFFGCPRDNAPLLIVPGGGKEGADRLECSHCKWRFDRWVGTKRGLSSKPPSLFLPTMDSLHQWMQDPGHGAVFGDGKTGPRAFLADEIHLYSSIPGAQTALTMRRLLYRMRVNGAGAEPIAIGMSATLGEPGQSFGRMLGRTDVQIITPHELEASANPRGREYFYFIQPEIESRDQDVSGASTAVQSIMSIAHSMRRRTGDDGGYRGVVFLDSVDKVRRLHNAYSDAEDKELAALRSTRYPKDALTGAEIGRCCGRPEACSIFNDGECWIFAASDRAQAYADKKPWTPGKKLSVAKTPVTSQASDNIERQIRESDVVFATSSLEVGYDDPDITFVFQHYGPQNLASFIQRKGRAGRGMDDRPVTGITLSLFSPRDSYWFHRPQLMLDASGFMAPLNPDNHFVRRGQMLSMILDAAGYVSSRANRPAFDAEGRLSDDVWDVAKTWLEACFGSSCWAQQGARGPADFWERYRAQNHVALAKPDLMSLRQAMLELPMFLSTPINLPVVDIRLAEEEGLGSRGAGGSEDGAEPPTPFDVGLFLHLAAPGNITRHFEQYDAYWRPPTDGLAPWFADQDYAVAQRIELLEGRSSRLLDEMPSDVRSAFGSQPATTLIRPRIVTLSKAGFFKSGDWNPLYEKPDGGVVKPAKTRSTDCIDHETRGTLRMFSIVQCQDDAGHLLPSFGSSTVDTVRCFMSDVTAINPSTGLTVAHVAWGADIELKFCKPGMSGGDSREPEVIQQRFMDPTTRQPTLHGYTVETEGLRLDVSSLALDKAVEAELAAATATTSLGFPQIHAFIANGLLEACVDRFSAVLVGRLVAQAMTSLSHSAEIEKLLQRRWDSGRLFAILKSVRTERVALDPTLSDRRIDRAMEALNAVGASPRLRELIQAVDRPEAMQRHIRSVILHSIAVRFRDLFVLIAQGDERRVHVHAKLPIFFDERASDTITIAEIGQYGDGTTRAVREKWSQLSKLWTDGFPTFCPNAEEDQQIERLLGMTEYHDTWRTLNINTPGNIERVARDLATDEGSSTLSASVSNVLFGRLDVGIHRFRTLDLAVALRDVRKALEAELGRDADGWELVTRVHQKCESGADLGPLNELFDAYQGVEEIEDATGSLSPKMRFAEQVYRLGQRLCPDGCRACVVQDSSLVPQGLTRPLVSRTMLQRFLATPC